MSTSASPWAGRRRSSTDRAGDPSSRDEARPQTLIVSVWRYSSRSVFRSSHQRSDGARGLREGAVRAALQPADLAPEGSHDPAPIRALDRERGARPGTTTTGRRRRGSVSGPPASRTRRARSSRSRPGGGRRPSRSSPRQPGRDLPGRSPTRPCGFPSSSRRPRGCRPGGSTARCRSAAGSRRDRRRGRAGRGSPGRGCRRARVAASRRRVATRSSPSVGTSPAPDARSQLLAPVSRRAAAMVASRSGRR